MATIDFDVEDYLDEVSESTLVEELNRRRNKKLKTKYVFPEFKSREELREFIYDAIGLKRWHTKERLINEIEQLF